MVCLTEIIVDGLWNTDNTHRTADFFAIFGEL